MLADIFAPGADAGDAGGVHSLPARGRRARRPPATCWRWRTTLDVTDHLARITAPTLVVHRDRDRAAPLEQGRALAAGIPGARLEVLAGRDHLPYIGDAAGLATSIRRFLGLPAPRAPGRRPR